MAAYDLEEQEQLAEIKAWWKQYGNLLVNLLTVVALLVLAWQGWNWYQRSQSAQAALYYNMLQQAAQGKDTQKIKATSGELIEKFGGTHYSQLGALIAAKAMVEAGDAKTAKLQLLWVVENGKDELKDLARLRLASLHLDEKEHDLALKYLEGRVSPGFEARFSDIRGDAFAEQGKKPEALIAYKSALKHLSDAEKEKNDPLAASGQNSSAVLRQLIEQKIDALGGGN